MKLRYKIINGFLATLVLGVVALGGVLSYSSDCGPAPELTGDGPRMKAVLARCYGSPDILEFTDVEKPAPAEHEVLIRVHNAAVNPLDWHYMRGTPYVLRLMNGMNRPADPRTGVDFSGTVEAIGDKVTRYRVGDEIFGGGNGAFGEYLVKREDSESIAQKPASITFEQAAAIPIAGMTALQAVRLHGQVRPGDRVLINGASGGVGTLAVQIAKHLGAEVTGVCSTRNLEMVRSLGADHVIDYTAENYTESGKTYDVILDMVGNHSISDNRKALEPQGRMVMVGGKKGNWIAPFMGTIKASIMAPFVDQHIGSMLARFNTSDLEDLAGMIQAGVLESPIDSRYPLSETAEAVRKSESGRARGKIIVDVMAESSAGS